MNLVELADKVGTPCYVYDLEKVVAACADLTGALPQPATLYYSLKANPHPMIVAALAAEGCHAEVSSKGEIDAAIEG
ncbi:MAG: type III PLP-dependent enzyme, partial [Kibdelosporangium sp.]